MLQVECLRLEADSLLNVNKSRRLLQLFQMQTYFEC